MVLRAEVRPALFLENEILKCLLAEFNFIGVHLEVGVVGQLLLVEILLVMGPWLGAAERIIQ